MPKFLDVTNIPAARSALGFPETFTAVKTANYTAAVGEIVRCDPSSSGFTVTLPVAPAFGSRVVVKKLDMGSNAVIVSAGSGQTFNDAASSSSIALALGGETITVQYDGSGVWVVTDRSADELFGPFVQESTDLFLRMDVRPTYDRQMTINTLIKNLKEYGLWDGLDGFYVFAAHDQQAALLNWRRNAANFSTINSPVFSVDVGFTGDGVAASLTNTNSATVNAEALDVMGSVWFAEVPTVGEGGFHIWWTTWGWALHPAATSTQARWRQSLSANTDTASSRIGLFTTTRTAANAAKLYRDGATLATTTTAYDSGLTYSSTAPIRVFSTTGTTQFSTSTVSCLAYGAAYSDSEVALFYNAVNNYMATVGNVPGAQ